MTIRDQGDEAKASSDQVIAGDGPRALHRLGRGEGPAPTALPLVLHQ